MGASGADGAGGAAARRHVPAGTATPPGAATDDAEADAGMDSAPDERHKGHHAPSLQSRHMRLAVMMLVAMMAHNFPEGMAVAVASVSSAKLGVVMAVAIALHNIPEGISVAVPVLAATRSRWMALLAALLSGLPEPIGALAVLSVAQATAAPLFEAGGLDAVLVCVAGVMVAVSLLELVPTALQHVEHAGPRTGRLWWVWGGALVGAGVCWGSLLALDA